MMNTPWKSAMEDVMGFTDGYGFFLPWMWFQEVPRRGMEDFGELHGRCNGFGGFQMDPLHDDNCDCGDAHRISVFGFGFHEVSVCWRMC